MEEHGEFIREIIDTASEYAPTELSIIIKLAKLSFEIFNREDDDVNTLYKSAFKEAVENLIKYENDNYICELLNKFKIIDSPKDVQNLYESLKRDINQSGYNIENKDIIKIVDDIAYNFKIILLEDRYNKLYKWFLLCKKSNALDGDITEIKERLNEIYDKTYRIKTDNKFYEKEFVKPLFRHNHKLIIRLKDVFVKPNVKANSEQNSHNVFTEIKNFVENDECDVLFIEGFGGYGKTSIVSSLAYNYAFNIASEDVSFFYGRQLIIIRLRDIEGNNKVSSISRYLNDMDSIEDNAILIFDGLDELCMIENRNGSTIAEDIIKSFSYHQRKIIITTRPTYIDYNDINSSSVNFKYKTVEICCFDEKQRKEFADYFAEKDKSNMETIEYVKSLPLGKQGNESIYGSPFLLYLILSGGIQEKEKDNSWLLMHRLFHDELFNPPYDVKNKINEDIADKIYQFNCDIAYEMFKTKNKKLFLRDDELKNILPNNDLTDIVRKSHGLFSYMRRNNDGAVEFVHNNIRDYFLCEKVLRELDKFYSNKCICGYAIALRLCELLKYDFFTFEVKSFIKEALLTNEYKHIINMCDNEHLSSIFDLFYMSGGVIRYDFIDCNYNYNYEIISKYVINNSAHIYHSIYIPRLKKGEYIHWFSDDAILISYRNRLGCSILSMMCFYLNRSYLYKIRIYSYFSIGIYYYPDMNFIAKTFLPNLNISESDLRECNIQEIELPSAKLNGADLSGATLDRVKLYDSDLTGTNFSKAILYDVDLSMVKNISKAIFYETMYDEETKFPDGFIVKEPEFIKIEK